jgi:hypothetical protein
MDRSSIARVCSSGDFFDGLIFATGDVFGIGPVADSPPLCLNSINLSTVLLERRIFHLGFSAFKNRLRSSSYTLLDAWDRPGADLDDNGFLFFFCFFFFFTGFPFSVFFHPNCASAASLGFELAGVYFRGVISFSVFSFLSFWRKSSASNQAISFLKSLNFSSPEECGADIVRSLTGARAMCVF